MHAADWILSLAWLYLSPLEFAQIEEIALGAMLRRRVNHGAPPHHKTGDHWGDRGSPRVDYQGTPWQYGVEGKTHHITPHHTTNTPMAKKEINNEDLDTAWGFYLEDQGAREVQRRCEAVGISAHINTISRWINRGLPSKGAEAFKDRLARIQDAAAALSSGRGTTMPRSDMAPSPAATQAEIMGALANPLSDAALAVQLGSANLDRWREHMNSQILHATIASEKVMESLMGVDPADTRALVNVMTAWKNCVSAQRGIIESNSVLRGMGDQDAPGPAGSDREIMENFQGWTPEEHRAFRVDGIWPESRGPAPDFVLETTAPM